MRNLILAALLLFTSSASAEIVGVNEAAHVPQHPEFRLRNLATRARKWRNGQLALTFAATPMLPALKNPKAMPPSAKYRYNAKSGIILRDPSEPRRPLLFDSAAAHVGPFRSAFIDDLRRFDVWRTMDLSKTNGNAQAEWVDRPTLDGPVGQWFELGWPWELQIEAANLAEVDLWICVPHMANDEYVRELGKLFAAKLDVERTVYLEYSNECWNTGPAFKQSRWIVANLADDKWAQRNRAYGKRAAEVWKLFTEGGAAVRVQRVLAGQAAAIRVIREALEGCESVGGRPDVVSCAAYFNPGKEGLYDHFQVNGPDDDHAFALMRQSIQTTRSPWWQAHGEFAKKLNKPLIAYEGGSHIAADAKHRRDAKYVRWLHDLDRDPRIKDIYKLLRETWRDAGGDGLLYFQRLAGPTRFGSWGHREYARDDAPKNQAIDEHLAELQD